jgi:DNA polymerase III sliding clamp (beta) subunit (PCNA family)
MKSNKELSMQSGLSMQRIQQLKEILKSFKGIDFKVTKETKVIEFENRWDDYREKKYGGFKTEANVFYIETKFGSYTASVPTSSDLNKEYLDFFKLTEDKQTQIETFAKFEADILPYLKEAAKYVSNSNVTLSNEAMKSVLIEFVGDKMCIVGTNAHILYLKEFECEYSTQYQMLISIDVIKDLAQRNKPINEIGIVSKFVDKTQQNCEGDNVFSINGVMFTEEWNRYPQYRNVIPNETQFMEFEAKKMLQCIDSVKNCANKYSNKINFHLNGSIQASAINIDFGKEATNSVPYISKNFPDLDIAFNHKYLIQSIKSFKAKELRMYASTSNRPAIITDGDAKVLVMPTSI